MSESLFQRIQRMRQEKAEKVEKARALIDHAESAGRSLNASEEREFNRLHREIREGSESIDRLESLLDAEMRIEDLVPIAGEQPQRRRLPKPEQWIDARTGQEIRVLRPGDSAVEVHERDHPGDRSEVGLGQFLRALTVGPRNDAERRSLGSSDASGLIAIPTSLYPQIVDNVRARAVTMQAGASVISMEHGPTLKIVRVTADATPEWRNPLATVSEVEPTFGGVDFTARSLSCIVRASLELIEDAVGLEEALVANLASAFANEIDRVALEGSGTDPEPEGLITYTGLTEHDAANNPLDWATLLAFQQALFAANGDALDAIALHPRDWANLFGAVGTDGHYVAPPAPLAGVRFLPTTQVDATTTSVAYGGRWGELFVAIRKGFTLRPLTERYADTGEVGFVAHARFDVGPVRPAMLGRIINLTAS